MTVRRETKNLLLRGGFSPSHDSRLTTHGGILLDLFLILVLLGGAAAGWVAWKKGSLAGLLKGAVSAVPSAPASLSPEPAPEPDIDVSDRSARLQARVRELLTERGVGEKHVLRSYNAERQDQGIQWLEATLELRRPASFDVGAFLSALAPFLSESRLSLMEDRRAPDGRTLELGDRKRVYQRLIFRNN
jgi:hypothetical protein